MDHCLCRQDRPERYSWAISCEESAMKLALIIGFALVLGAMVFTAIYGVFMIRAEINKDRD